MSNFRALIVGDSGTGKTAALWSLIEAGYSVKVADFDNGADVLKIKMYEACKKLEPDAAIALRRRLSIRTFKDTLIGLGDSYSVKRPLALNRFVKSLDKWGDEGAELDNLSKWGSDTVFVIDTLNFLGRAMLYSIQDASKRTGQPVTMNDYGSVQNLMATYMDRLVSDQYSCHIIVNTHIDYREFHAGTFAPVGVMERDITGTDEKKVSTAELEIRAIPTTFGAKFGPKVGTYFNFTLGTFTKQFGTSTKHLLHTASNTVVDLKCPLPVPRELPLETGLATLLRAWSAIEM